MPRAASFVADRNTRGFTAPYPRPPRLRRHLTQCPPHRHGVEHSFSFGPSARRQPILLRPLLTSRSGSTPSPFQAQGEISPGKNALLHCTTAGSTPLPLDHESFAVSCPLALVGTAFYPVLVHRPAVSLHASSPRSVALMQLRFASFAVTSLRRDSHPKSAPMLGAQKEEGREASSAPTLTPDGKALFSSCWASSGRPSRPDRRP